MESQRKHHFVLVHGACHGAWCWYKVATLLESHGHKVTALDLAASGIDQTKVLDINTFKDYIQPLISFMDSLPPQDKIILVAHSMGGLAISLAMEAFPDKIFVSVFASAAMPGPDLSYKTIRERYSIDNMDSVLTFDDGADKPATTLLLDPVFMATKMYQNSPPEDLKLASLLIRPIRVSNEEFFGSMMLTQERYGSIHRVYALCDQDLTNEDLQKWMIQENPPDKVMVISGSDHMMLSKPLELSSCLLEIANY